MFFLKKKKENKIEEFNYEGFTTWLNKILQKSLPENTKAVNFNIYEKPQPYIYGIQFVATSSFDLNNDDGLVMKFLVLMKICIFLLIKMVGKMYYKKLKKMLSYI